MTPDHAQSLVRFATVQLFAVIYLQKLAIGPASFPLSVPLLILLASLGWMVASGYLHFVASRLATYVIFVGCCLVSQALHGGSLPSVADLILLYAMLTVSTKVSTTVHRCIMDRFVLLMVIPASIIIFQFVYQKATGLTNPLNMERLLPKSLLYTGFIYQFNYPWNSTFVRPNGFFFLETSFASLFVAAAAIVEVVYFWRPWRVLLFLIATLLSMGGTGNLMLLIATPFLLGPHKPRAIAILGSVAVLALTAAHTLDLPLPLISRLNELDNARSSGSGRLLLPAIQFMRLVFDPSYLFSGDGAGSISPTMAAWPAVKLLTEYGLLSVIAYVVFYVTVSTVNGNLALKAALTFVYMFTGEYLLSTVLVELLIMLCFLLEPEPDETPAIRAIPIP